MNQYLMLGETGIIRKLAIRVYMSPVVEGRDLCQPLGEPPALQLVSGSFCLPQSSSVGQ